MPVEVQTFESPFGKARVVMFSDGTPWFVAKDVCEGLGLSMIGGAGSATRKLKHNQKQTLKSTMLSKHGACSELFSGNGSNMLVLITRGGFNDLILESRKPVAREYRQWVTDKVLPALQDTGTFTDEGHPEQQRVSCMICQALKQWTSLQRALQKWQVL